MTTPKPYLLLLAVVDPLRMFSIAKSQNAFSLINHTLTTPFEDKIHNRNIHVFVMYYKNLPQALPDWNKICFYIDKTKEFRNVNFNLLTNNLL